MSGGPPPRKKAKLKGQDGGDTKKGVGGKKATRKPKKVASVGKEQLFKKIAAKRARSWVKRWVDKELVDGRVVQMLVWCSDEQPAIKGPIKHSNRAAPAAKVYNCGICNKTFSDASGLRKHAKIHGEKLFECEVQGCNKRFIDRSKLKRHQLVHTGERPFPCPYPNCNKRFSLDFNLKSHLKLHTGDKPYKCTFSGCGKRFAQVSNLKAHRKIHERAANQNKKIHERASTTTATKPKSAVEATVVSTEPAVPAIQAMSVANKEERGGSVAEMVANSTVPVVGSLGTPFSALAGMDSLLSAGMPMGGVFPGIEMTGGGDMGTPLIGGFGTALAFNDFDEFSPNPVIRRI